MNSIVILHFVFLFLFLVKESLSSTIIKLNCVGKTVKPQNSYRLWECAYICAIYRDLLFGCCIKKSTESLEMYKLMNQLRE